jgi:AhpD family alkylhydroperoxidase
MNTRFKMGKIQPNAYKAMNALDQYVRSSTLTPLEREMINIKVAQLNGCAYCVNIHTRDARKLGETEQRIYLISVWREAPNIFSD